MFSTLVFRDHKIQGATIAQRKFDNQWTVSVVAGPKESGLYGILGEDTFEVAVIRPDGEMLEDVLSYQTPVQVSTILRLVEML
jgi:hypothetical protein